MRLSIDFLYLPASLLLLLASQPSPAHPTQETRNRQRWPSDSDPHAQYERVNSPHRRRELEAIQAHLDAGHNPVRVRKMTEDEGEMFFPEYWGFDIEPAQKMQSLRAGFEEDDRRLLANSSADICMRPSFSVHSFESEDQYEPEDTEVKDVLARSAGNKLLLKRFDCPTNTNACTDISQPYYCCPAGEMCMRVTDTGLGPVGCCPSGATCSGIIAGCSPGNVQCPQSLGGACCIPGFSCYDVGCISNVIVTMISTMGQVSSTSSTASSIVSTTSGPVVITVISSTTLVASTTATASGGTVTNTVTASITVTATAAEKVTSGVTTTTLTTPITTITPTTSIIPDACPTGFYACSAYYPGAGCCRVGRDCSPTSCPTTASITIVSSGRTIVVPLVSDATTVATASCARGWAACPVSAGGNCCPSNFACGTDSWCTTMGAVTATVAKETPAVGSIGTKADIKTGLAVVLIGAVGFAMMI